MLIEASRNGYLHQLRAIFEVLTSFGSHPVSTSCVGVHECMYQKICSLDLITMLPASCFSLKLTSLASSNMGQERAVLLFLLNIPIMPIILFLYS